MDNRRIGRGKWTLETDLGRVGSSISLGCEDDVRLSWSCDVRSASCPNVASLYTPPLPTKLHSVKRHCVGEFQASQCTTNTMLLLGVGNPVMDMTLYHQHRHSVLSVGARCMVVILPLSRTRHVRGLKHSGLELETGRKTYEPVSIINIQQVTINAARRTRNRGK